MNPDLKIKWNVRWSRSGLVVLVVAGLLALLAFSMKRKSMTEIKAWVRNTFPQVQQISTDEYREWLGKTNAPQHVLLDIRTPKEFAISHLPGARLVPPGTKPQTLVQQYPSNTLFIVYCSVGYRSSEFATQMIQEGFPLVKNLEGSIFEWANKDYPLVTDDHPATKVHPFDKEWGKLLKPSHRAEVP